MDNIKQLEREVELLKELVELKEKVLELEKNVPSYPGFPVYPTTPYPYQPFTYPWITNTDHTTYYYRGLRHGRQVTSSSNSVFDG